MMGVLKYRFNFWEKVLKFFGVRGWVCVKCGKNSLMMRRGVCGTRICRDCSGRSRYTGVERK